MRRAFHRLHRWVSLTFAAIWIVQSVTGMLLVFHWELTDLAYEATSAKTDLAAISARVAAFEDVAGNPVKSIWTTAGLPHRYKLYLANGDSVIVAGNGEVLEKTNDLVPALIDTALDLHHEFLAGEAGQWFIGVSGILLLTNLVMGIRLAWVKSGQWTRAFRLAQVGNGASRRFAQHRAIGLWAVVPAIILVGTGTLLRFEDGIAKHIGGEATMLEPIAPEASTFVSLAQASRVALSSIPGSALAAVTMPNREDATYRFRLLEPGELRKAYGTSVVWVNANDGSLRKVTPASKDRWQRSFINSLFATHTGEAAGWLGRIAVFLLAIWLAVMIVLGLQLWWARTAKRKAHR